MTTCEILTVAVPVLLMLTVWVAVLPTATFPKLILPTLGERTPAAELAGLPVAEPAPDAAVVYPAQLENIKLAVITIAIDKRANGLPLPLPQGTRGCVCVRVFKARTV